MKRLFIGLMLAGLLAACATTGGTSGEPNASSDTTPASAEASAATSGGASGTVSAACEEAFAPIGELSPDSLSDLGDLAEVAATVEACESIADWSAGASTVIGGEVNPNVARMLLEIRCADPGAGDAPICEELVSS
jgi:hypothetical protein